MDKENIVRFPGSTKHLFEFSGHEIKARPGSVAVCFYLVIINYINGNMEREENCI